MRSFNSSHVTDTHAHARFQSIDMRGMTKWPSVRRIADRKNLSWGDFPGLHCTIGCGALSCSNSELMTHVFRVCFSAVSVSFFDFCFIFFLAFCTVFCYSYYCVCIRLRNVSATTWLGRSSCLTVRPLGLCAVKLLVYLVLWAAHRMSERFIIVTPIR